MPPQDQTREGVSDRIRSERNRLRLTQDELAAAIGVHKMTVVKWESGVQAPRAAEKEKLAARFGRTPVWLDYGDAGVAAAIEGEIAAAEARGYQRAMDEMRDRLLGIIDEALSESKGPGGTSSGPSSVPVYGGPPPMQRAEELEAELRAKEKTRRKSTRR